MTDLPYVIERAVHIPASRDTVWRFLTESERFARWWGDGSTIEARVGGRVWICHPGGATASGEVRTFVPRERLVFSYGYEEPARAIAPGGSLVSLTLTDREVGTSVGLRHDVADQATRDEHVPGWRHQLARFARAVTDEQHADVTSVIDRYFAAWNEPDAESRRILLEQTTAPDVSFADPFGIAAGRNDLAGHITAAREHLAGVRLARRGPVRHIHGTALADWVATRPDGEVAMSGTNAFDLAPLGRIGRIIGIPS